MAEGSRRDIQQPIAQVQRIERRPAPKPRRLDAQVLRSFVSQATGPSLLATVELEDLLNEATHSLNAVRAVRPGAIDIQSTASVLSEVLRPLDDRREVGSRGLLDRGREPKPACLARSV